MKTKVLTILCAYLSFLSLNTNASNLNSKNKNNGIISGYVYDNQSGDPLDFISVVVKGTTIMSQTNKDGYYVIKNTPTNSNFILETQSLGYKTVSKGVNKKDLPNAKVNFNLDQDLVCLDAVVVSANRYQTKRREASTLVQVITPLVMEKTESQDLSQVLNFQPGVRVEDDCQNCGFSQVRLNGLEGHYTQILMNSRSTFSALSGVYGLEQIPTNMIQSVEVVRGGGSALFGSSAIAGTVNIITKEPLSNSGEVSHTISNIDGSNSYENNTNMNVSLVSKDYKTGLVLFAKNRERSGYDNDGDGFTEMPELNGQSLGLHTYYNINNYNKLTLEYHHISEKRRGGNKLDLPPHLTDLTESIEHSVNSGNVNWKMYNDNQSQNVEVYSAFQATDRDSYYSGYGHTEGLNFMGGAQYNLSMKRFLFMPATFTVGVESSFESLKDYSYEGVAKTYEEMKTPTVDQDVKIGSLFFQNEWSNKRFSVLLGGRVDKHNLIDDAIFSPRVNFRYNPTESINIRLSYAAGFRAPQAFDEDLHIGNVGDEVSRINLDPNLKEEKSQSLSLSADLYQKWGEKWQANFMVNGFYTILDDAFTLVEDTERNTAFAGDGVAYKLRVNSSGSKVYGLNVDGKLAYGNKVQFQGGMTFEKAEYEDPQSSLEIEALKSRRITRTPDYYGYLVASYNPIKPLQISLNGTYTGEMLVLHETIEKNVETPNFYDVGTKISYNFKVNKNLTMQLNGGVNNIFNEYQDDFDKGADRDSGYIYGPASPRVFFAGVKISF